MGQPHGPNLGPDVENGPAPMSDAARVDAGMRDFDALVEEYIKFPATPMSVGVTQHWKAAPEKFNPLKIHVAESHSMPAGSAAVERLFSSCGLRKNDLRGSTSVQTVEATVTFL